MNKFSRSLKCFDTVLVARHSTPPHAAQSGDWRALLSCELEIYAGDIPPRTLPAFIPAQ